MNRIYRKQLLYIITHKHPLDHQKSKSARKTFISALLAMPKSLCGSQYTVENSERDGNT